MESELRTVNLGENEKLDKPSQVKSEVILSHHFIILFLRKKVRPSLLFEIRRFVLRYRHVILFDNMFYWTAWNK